MLRWLRVAKNSPRWSGLLRVSVFLLTVNLALTAIYLPRALAQAEASVKQSGLDLLKQVGPLVVGPPQAVSVNGQRMFLASKQTELPLEQVLATFERHCRDNSGGLAQAVGELPATVNGVELPAELRDPARWMTSREDEGGNGGQIACLARHADQHEPKGRLQGFLDRVSAFLASGDLSKIGDMRYVIARKDEKTGMTHVLAMWTQGPFDIPAMFPPQGDAPGRDSAQAPRPLGGKRVLSAEIPDQPYALRMYDSDRSADEVLDTYARDMAQRGWKSQVIPATPEFDINENVQVFAKDAAAVLVVVTATPQKKTGVTLVEMGSSGVVRTSLHARP